MERTRCPQCNAPIGGVDHRPDEGVQRATELEEELGRLTLTREEEEEDQRSNADILYEDAPVVEDD